jgi:hypothetical protein
MLIQFFDMNEGRLWSQCHLDALRAAAREGHDPHHIVQALGRTASIEEVRRMLDRLPGVTTW